MPTYILANNGECVCTKHLYLYGVDETLRDSRGERAMEVTPEIRAVAIAEYGFDPKCEQCKGEKP